MQERREVLDLLSPILERSRVLEEELRLLLAGLAAGEDCREEAARLLELLRRAEHRSLDEFVAACADHPADRALQAERAHELYRARALLTSLHPEGAMALRAVRTWLGWLARGRP